MFVHPWDLEPYGLFYGEHIAKLFLLLKIWIFVRFFFSYLVFWILPNSPRQIFLFWQTRLLCIIRELTGGWSLSVAVGVAVAVAMGFIGFCGIICTYQEIQWSPVWSVFFIDAIVCTLQEFTWSPVDTIQQKIVILVDLG